MKIDKKRLRQIIKEEVQKFEERAGGGDRFSTQDANAALQQQRGSQGVGASGINDAERGVMMGLMNALKVAAAKGNITSGAAAAQIERLMGMLEKVAGTPAEQEQGQ